MRTTIPQNGSLRKRSHPPRPSACSSSPSTGSTHAHLNHVLARDDNVVAATFRRACQRKDPTVHFLLAVNLQVLAVKKLDSTVMPFQSSDDFAELVSNISMLHHPNLNELVGYCMEHGQHLLVYDFHRNGSLYDLLHLLDEYNKPLSWNSCVKIALGSARALELSILVSQSNWTGNMPLFISSRDAVMWGNQYVRRNKVSMSKASE